MSRFFLEMSYQGTNYSGFQKQENSNTIQTEVEKAFAILTRTNVSFTGSSRTDAGVHALQNFFHFDFDKPLHPHFIYKMNAILPDDIVIINILPTNEEAHCRFNATSRLYKYFIYQNKDPFLKDRAHFFPFRLDFQLLNKAADILLNYQDFSSFSKRNTQVNNYICNIVQSEWRKENNLCIYHVKANRFLRGMVRGLTGTMLKVGRGKLSLEAFREIIEQKDCSKADFSVPAKGLFLTKVEYPDSIFAKI